MAAAGVSQDDIASAIINSRTGRPIGKATLQRQFRHELTSGRVQANFDVVAALHKAACNGNVAAIKLWLVNTMKWRGEPLAVEDRSDEKVVVVIDSEDLPRS